jgi:transcription elongation factor GreA
MTRHPLTKTGVERLREELAKLKKVDRPRIIAAIAEARAHGDLRENAEYHAAKEQQGFIEGRIQHLEYTISHAQIIDVAKLNPGNRVVFGATVTLCDQETSDETQYQIVGDVEADIKHNRIAVSSPISRALIGREVGDLVVVRAPVGERGWNRFRSRCCSKASAAWPPRSP